VQIAIDDSKWPRVYVTWPEGTLDDTAFEAMLQTLSALNDREQRYVVVHDARRAARPTPRQRALAAAQQKADTPRTKRLLRATALVVSSPLIASVVTAINWIAPSPFPQKIFSSFSDADRWATEQLHRPGD
jgi:hypothetical protein